MFVKMKWWLLEGAGDGGSGGGSGGGQGQGGGSGDGGQGQGGGAGDGGKQGDPKPWVNPDGTFAEGWQSNVPEEYRATAANFRNIPDILKSYRSMQQVVSGKLDGYVKVPGQDAKPEERAAALKAFGIEVPDKPEGYGITKPTNELAPFYDENAVKAFTTEAVKLGLTKEQANALVNMRLTEMKGWADAEVKESNDFLAANRAEMKKVWGNDMEARLNDAKQMLMSIDPSANLEAFEVLPASLIIGLANFKAKVSPGNLISTEAFGNKVTPSSLAMDIINNPNNPDHKAYHDIADPRHRDVVKKVLDAAAKG